ncbi:hypothetical protein C1O66_14505 [Paucibacter aquatile]|jgi:hypothetical protein|uniref:Uncharacterized protein n=2 Tax=Sphaerotilaceae TaxID=2975441 RepID=A0A2N8KYS7_9BURK|nr:MULTISPECIES: hypothetical protein [Roseateles]PND38616.1 hypothetical protein C1O66_14505 [Paucibacter aquatile]
MLEQAYTKTEQGRAEIKNRALPLSRSLRNLLLVIDDSKSAQQWLGLVQGITAADIAFLIDQGLIAPTARAGSAAGLAPAAPQAPALPSLDYQALYAYLTGAAREHLGLIKGYRWVLDVERCGDLPALQQLALRFVDEVRQAQGDAVAFKVRQSLGL